jgi:hypothetical protein
MKFPRLPHLRTAKFAPLAIFSLFFLTNLTGFYFSPALAPTVSAASTRDDLIPLDIPQSGDCDLDKIIFETGKRQGVDPRFIHAVIKAGIKIRSGSDVSRGREGPDATDAGDREAIQLRRSKRSGLQRRGRHQISGLAA